MNRRQIHATFLAAGFGGLAAALGGLAFAPTAHAQGLVEGRDYTRIDPPQPVSVPPGKVEVLEFFSYACPHCHSFEPALQAWTKQLPPDVVVKRVPVPFMFNAENFQRTYYALESIGMAEPIGLKVFSAVHVDRQRLDKLDDLAALVAKNGGDAAKFTAAFKSFSVATSVAKAKKMNADYRIDGVPTLAIQGRWMTSPSIAGNVPRSLAAASALIEMARKG